MRCNPASSGAKTATVTLNNNSEAHPYTFDVKCTGEADTDPPDVSSIVRADASPTNAASVNFTVTFDESVTGVDATDFSLDVSGVSGASIGTVTGSGTTYTVPVNTGTGDGTLSIDLTDNDSIEDGSGNKLGGTGAGNGNYTTGEAYTIDKTDPTDPTPSSSSHTMNVASNDNTVDVSITGASDGSGSGVDGFEIEWDKNAAWTPSENKEQEETWTGATFTANTDGDWYFHIATVDNVGNWTSTQHLGPFPIDTAAPAAPGTPDLSAGSDTGTSDSDNITNETIPQFTGTCETGATVTLTSSADGALTPTGTCSGGNYDITPTLTANTHNITASQEDAAGNSSSASSALSVTVDTTGPTVTINQDGGQADPTNSSPIDFAVVFSESVSGFASGDVTLTGTAGATTDTVSGSGTTYNVAASGMSSDGTVIADINSGVATDTAGNNNAASTSTDKTVTYDTADPAAPSTPNLAAGSDTGTSSTDNITSDTTPQFTGTCETGATVTLTSSVDGALTPTDTCSGGNYDITPTLTANTHNITASQEDAAGNSSSASAALSVTVDTTGPTVTINQDGGQADPTNSSPIDFAVVFSESVSGFASGDVTLTGTAGATTDTVTGSGTTYNAAASGMTSDGTVIAEINSGVATDTAGNNNAASTSTDKTVTYDTTVTAPSTPDLDSRSDTGTSDSDDITSDTTPQFTGTCETGATVTLTSSVDGALTPTGTCSGGNYDITTTLTENTHNIAASQVDVAGNSSSASTALSVTVDTSIAAPSTPDLAAGSDTGTSPTDDITMDTTPQFTGTCETGATVTLTSSVDGSLTPTGICSGGIYDITTTLTENTHNVTASQEDAAGNSSSASSALSVTVDTTAPTVTINQDGGQADPTNSSPIDFAVVFSESVSGFASGDVTLTGTAGATTDTVTGSGTTYNAAASGMTSDGTVIAEINSGVATDTAGNNNAASTSTDKTVTYDTTVTAPSTPDLDSGSDTGTSDSDDITSDTTPQFTGTCETGATVTLTSSVDGALTPTGTCSGGSYDITTTLTENTHNIAASQVDVAGNSSSASTALSVTVDTSIAAPSTPDLAAGSDTGTSPTDDITMDTTPQFTGTCETGATVTLTSSVDGPLTPTDVCSSGSYDITTTLTENVHNVTAAQTDAAGNSSSASSALSVTVDITDPDVASTSSTTPDNTYGIGANINVTVTTTEAVISNGYQIGVMMDTSVAVTTSYVDATTFTGTYTVSAGENTTDLDGDSVSSMGINALEDLAGNSTISIAIQGTTIEDTSDIVIDGDAPTVTINQDGGQADPTNSSPIDFAVVFSESVSGFATGDVTITGSAGATTGTVTGSGTTYNVAVSGMTQDGTVTVAIEAGKATDAGGNPNAASTSTDDTVTYRNHPTIEKVFSPDTIGAGDTSTLTFTLANPNTLTTLNGLNFTDDLSLIQVKLAATPNIGGTCNSNNVLAAHFNPALAAGGGQVNLIEASNYSLAPGDSCTITVDVTSTLLGDANNISGNIGSTETGAGTDSASAILSVNKPTLTINTAGSFGADNIDSTTGNPDPGAIDCPNAGGTAVCTTQFDYNDNVTLEVTVDASSSFTGWTGDCSGTGNTSITMNGDKTCTATFEAFPEIDVQRPAGAGNSIADGGTDNLGDQAPGAINLTYTIDNSAGGAQLDVTDVTAPIMTNASNFNMSTAMPLNIAAGGTGTVEISFDVDALGAFTIDMEIANNDSDENPYNIQIAGTGAAVPEIDVLGNDTSIVSGDTTPSTADHTDFGNADFDGATIDRTFTIKNTGLADLDLTAGPPTIVIGGADAAEFTLKTDATTPVTAEGETTFTITFDPVDDTLKQATVTIANNDGDEDPYTFNIQGMGTGPSCEIDVQGNGVCIPHGDTSPSALDQTDFGEVLVAGGQVTYTYTIENTGSLDLTLTHNDHVMIGGAHAADFILATDAHTPVVARGGTTTFEITFDPTDAGLREATITIDNDDNDEHPYTFKVQGTGIVPEEPARGGRGAAPSTSRFPVGDGGGEFQADPVTMMVQPGTVPTGTQLFIERLPPRGDDPNIILGSLLFDISFLGPDGEYIYDFYPPIEICIKPTSRELRAAGGSFSNMNILAKHGSADWMMVPNPYERDGYLCVTTQRNSLFAIGVGYLPATGFAPGILHSLPDQPAEKDYQPMDDFVLEISELGLELPIIGVPLTEYGWDVTWLGDRAGYLEGTAFPTWAGNTAITAHVWDVNNDPGPFVNLHTLQHGDQVMIQAFGKHYLYEVRKIDKVRADNMNALPHDDYDVLTLITCQGYNESTGEYAWRIVVRAVLISVE